MKRGGYEKKREISASLFNLNLQSSSIWKINLLKTALF